MERARNLYVPGIDLLDEGTGCKVPKLSVQGSLIDGDMEWETKIIVVSNRCPSFAGTLTMGCHRDSLLPLHCGEVAFQ
jgi:hypothetical protein